MKRLLAVGFAITATLGALGLAAAQSSDDKMGSMGSSMGSMKSMSGMAMAHSFPISAQNGSGESGTASLSQKSGMLVVTLKLTGATGAQPAHIHKGSCANLDPKPAYPLTTVMAGSSKTTLKSVTLAKLTAGTYAINVHKSTTDLKDYVACGDLKVASTK